MKPPRLLLTRAEYALNSTPATLASAGIISGDVIKRAVRVVQPEEGQRHSVVGVDHIATFEDAYKRAKIDSGMLSESICQRMKEEGGMVFVHWGVRDCYKAVRVNGEGYVDSADHQPAIVKNPLLSYASFYWYRNGRLSNANGPAHVFLGHEMWCVDGSISASPHLCEEAASADTSPERFYELCSSGDPVVRKIAARSSNPVTRCTRVRQEGPSAQPPNTQVVFSEGIVWVYYLSIPELP